MSTIGMIGAGAWGTALAVHLARQGHRIFLWAVEDDLVAAMSERRENVTYLPGTALPEGIFPTSEMDRACDADIVVLACPSKYLRTVATQAADSIPSGAPVVILAKGIEDETLMLMSEVSADVFPGGIHENLVICSGPSFAREVADGFPTDVVVAAKSFGVSQKVQREFHSPFFRVYTSNDMIGLQVGGAIKNVIAIAAGGCDGLGLGLNARAALITRGLAEITRLGVAKGADPLTFLGLAGMGDLVLTCTGDLSRNRTLGMRVAHGESPKEVLESTRAVAEGFYSARAVYRLSRKIDVDMPITDLVYNVLYENENIQDAARKLMAREFKSELRGIAHG